MAVSEVPVRPGVAHQEMQVPVEGRVYSLELRWVGREERWYIDVRDENQTSLYTGIAVVLNFPLGIRCASRAFWPGVLLATDTSGANTEPGLDDFGDRVKLFYFDASELPVDVSATVVT